MFKGGFGLEKESLRVDTNGFLAHTPHPFESDPNIDRDFCENQTEIITNVCSSVKEVYDELAKLNKIVMSSLYNKDQRELLWPFSNPPYVKGEADIPIASFNGEFKGKELYRHYLAEKYGKMKMLYSGIHFNFSFSKEFLESGFEQSTYSSLVEYSDNVYLELAKKATLYSWLIVYLTAASPVTDGSFLNDEDMGKDILSKYASPRCSKVGYWNDFIPVLEYDSIESYVNSIKSYIESGQLMSPAELYYPIRLKPAGDNLLENLLKGGINHIELRMLDLNPLSPAGIMEEDIYFLHFLLVYLTSLGDEDFDCNRQTTAINNIKNSAKFDDENIMIEIDKNKSLPINQAALKVLHNMEDFYSRCNEPKVFDVIEYQKEKLLDKQKRYAVTVREKFGHNYVKSGLILADLYAKN